MDLQDVMNAYFSRKAKGDDPSPIYGIEAMLHEDTIDLSLTLKKDQHYCCMEWGCNTGFFRGRTWTRLRQIMQAHGIEVDRPLSMNLRMIIEQGALLSNSCQPKHFTYEIKTSEVAAT